MEKLKSLAMLFGGAPLRFGTNPLQQFRRDLLAGRYTPEKHAMRALVAQARRRDSELLAAEQQVRTLQRVLAARKRLLEATAAKTQITLPVAVQKMDTKKFQVYLTYGRRKIRLIESNAKSRYLKKLTCKGTLRQVFLSV